MWLCILFWKLFKISLETSLRRKMVHMRPMWLWLYSGRPLWGHIWKLILKRNYINATKICLFSKAIWRHICKGTLEKTRLTYNCANLRTRKTITKCSRNVLDPRTPAGPTNKQQGKKKLLSQRTLQGWDEQRHSSAPNVIMHLLKHTDKRPIQKLTWRKQLDYSL